jgi:hypothetical protein
MNRPPVPAPDPPPSPPRQIPPPDQPPQALGGPSDPIPYATPPVAGGRPTAFHWGLFLWSATVLGIWVALVLVLVPRFTRVFADFKLEVPLATRLLFGAHRVLVSGGLLVVAAVPVVLGFLSGRMSRGGRWGLRAVLTILFAALLLLTVFGLVVPMLDLYTGVTVTAPGR